MTHQPTPAPPETQPTEPVIPVEIIVQALIDAFRAKRAEIAAMKAAEKDAA